MAQTPNGQASPITHDIDITDETADGAVPPAGFLREYVDYCASQTDAPRAFHVASGLLALSTMIHSSACMWANGSDLYPNLYVMLTGASVLDRKSTALRIAKSIVSQVVPERVPAASPGSYEGLVRSVTEQPHLSVWESEFSRFLSQSRDGGYLTALKLGYTDLYDGEVNARQLSAGTTGEGGVVHLNLGAACATVHLESLSPTDFSGGFWARFFLVASSREHYLPESEYDDETVQRLVRIGTRITNFRAFGDGRLGPDRFTWTPDAMGMYADWSEQIDSYARGLPSRDIRQGVLGRTPTLSRKLAMLYCLNRVTAPGVDRNKRAIVTATDFEFAKRAVEIHAASVLSIGSSLARTEDMRSRRRVLEAVRSYGPCPTGVITRASEMLLHHLRPHLETLIEEKLIQAIPQMDGSIYYAAVSREAEQTAKREKEKRSPTRPGRVPTSIANAPVPDTVPYIDHDVYDPDEPGNNPALDADPDIRWIH